MTIKEAKRILKRIESDPSLADQFTEDEIIELEKKASEKK